MSERSCKVLILDHDPDVLTDLQQVLEDAGFDTTITWDCVEARELAQTTAFDVILVGSLPPEVAAKTFLRTLKPVPRTCLLLGVRESSAEPLHRFGFSGTVPKRDAHRVREAVQEYLRSKEMTAKNHDRSMCENAPI